MSKVTKKKKSTKKPVDLAAVTKSRGPMRKIKSFSAKAGSKTRKTAHLTCGHKRTCKVEVKIGRELRCGPCRPGVKARKQKPVSAKKPTLKIVKKKIVAAKKPVTKREPVSAPAAPAAASA